MGMSQGSLKFPLIKNTALAFVGLLLCSLCFSCGGGGGSGNGGSNPTITNASIDLNNMDSWEGINPIISDPTGDASDTGVDIESVFVAHDNEYFYIRIDIAGLVDSTDSKELIAQITFLNNAAGYDLSFKALIFLHEVSVERFEHVQSFPCSQPPMMQYPASNFLTWTDQSVVYRIRLSDIDFNLDGTGVEVYVSNNAGADLTTEVILHMDSTYLPSVTTVWPEQQSGGSYTIPNKTITIDGDITDWSTIDPVFEDRLDDVYGISSTNINEAFIAQDNDAYYFRFDLLSPPVVTTANPNPQVRFEIRNPANDVYYAFTAWLLTTIAGVNIEDGTSIWEDPDANVVHAYPESGYLAVNGRHIEYRVMKSDMEFDLVGYCMSGTAIIDGASDYTKSVLIE